MRTRTNSPFKSDARPGRPRHQPRHSPNSAPSTAWLEAQAAFATPAERQAENQPSGTGPVPVVVLRRSRPLDAETAAPPAAGPDAHYPAARPARVFRVLTPATPDGLPAAPALSLLSPTPGARAEARAGGLHVVPPSPQNAEAPPQTPRKRRQRRAQHAPGVATVITFATPAAAAPALPYREQVARLQQLMAALDDALALAQQASSFELTP